MSPGAPMAIACGSMEECLDETAVVPAPRGPPSDRALYRNAQKPKQPPHSNCISPCSGLRAELP